MKYIKQFAVILIISFIGELLNYFVPLPIPAGIYGLVLMLLCLKMNIFQYSAVKDTAKYLIEIMPLMFIPATVGLMTSWDVIKPVIVPYFIIASVSTFIVMFVSGRVTQAIILHSRKKSEIKQRRDYK